MNIKCSFTIEPFICVKHWWRPMAETFNWQEQKIIAHYSLKINKDVRWYGFIIYPNESFATSLSFP